MSVYSGPYQREYSVFTALPAMRTMFQKKFINDYDYVREDLVLIIKKGNFYFSEIEDDRYGFSKKYIHDFVNTGKTDFEKEFLKFEKKVKGLENFYSTNEKYYSLETYFELIKRYRSILPIYMAALDGVNFQNQVKKERRDDYTAWATKTRIRSEKVFKDGEMKFVPSFIKWLSENELKGYSENLIRHIQFEEFGKYAKQGEKLPGIDLLQKRDDFCVIVQSVIDNETIYYDDEAREELVKRDISFQKADEYKDIEKIKGVISYQGKTSGKVKIVLSQKDMGKVEEGDILVSQMTVPDYLPIMKKAAAFVTDEGGVLCHAAIVARELKKPCITGTKFATKALSDGDEVEVDADQGVVKKK